MGLPAQFEGSPFGLCIGGEFIAGIGDWIVWGFTEAGELHFQRPGSAFADQDIFASKGTGAEKMEHALQIAAVTTIGIVAEFLREIEVGGIELKHDGCYLAARIGVIT